MMCTGPGTNPSFGSFLLKENRQNSTLYKFFLQVIYSPRKFGAIYKQFVNNSSLCTLIHRTSRSLRRVMTRDRLAHFFAYFYEKSKFVVLESRRNTCS